MRGQCGLTTPSARPAASSTLKSESSAKAVMGMQYLFNYVVKIILILIICANYSVVILALEYARKQWSYPVSQVFLYSKKLILLQYPIIYVQ